MTDQAIAFIGAGNIARAIIGGLIEGGYDPAAIRAADPSADQRALLPAGIQAFESSWDAATDAVAVILCVKPNIVPTVTTELAEALAGTLVISVAAGVTVASLEGSLGRHAPVVRCMPNTPALVGAGMTGLPANDAVTPDQRELTDRIMRSVGRTHWFEDEGALDAVTAVSGSGPAYFFLVMEAMEAAGRKLGLDADTARLRVQQTALGAATMAQASEEPPATLRRNVTSPGGTTEAAINTLVGSELEAIFERALTAARDRAVELSGPAPNGGTDRG